MALTALNRNVNLRGMTYKTLYEVLDKSEDDFLRYLQDLGLIHERRTCRKCGSPCSLFDGGTRFRCDDRACRKTISMRAATMFDGSNLSLKKVFEMAYYWSRCNWNIPELQHQLRSYDGTTLARQTISNWGQYFRDICAEYFVENPIRIGGNGVFVEIDETFLTRRKYHRGHIRGNHGQWIFGGVVRGDASQCFMVEVDQRNAATLLPILQQYVLPGSTVVSDLWAAYGGIANLPQGYQHLGVNHSLHFVDPTDPRVHTQSVENCWMRFKKVHRKRNGCPKHMLKDYINEFMWRQKHAGPDAIYHLWEMAVAIYPVESHTPTPSEIADVAGEEEADAVKAVNRLSLDRVYIEDY